MPGFAVKPAEPVCGYGSGVMVRVPGETVTPGAGLLLSVTTTGDGWKLGTKVKREPDAPLAMGMFQNGTSVVVTKMSQDKVLYTGSISPVEEFNVLGSRSTVI